MITLKRRPHAIIKTGPESTLVHVILNVIIVRLEGPAAKNMGQSEDDVTDQEGEPDCVLVVLDAGECRTSDAHRHGDRRYDAEYRAHDAKAIDRLSQGHSHLPAGLVDTIAFLLAAGDGPREKHIPQNDDQKTVDAD